MSTKVHIIDSMHTKTLALQKTKKICCFCVWDIPVIMLIMKIIYEIKSYKTYNIVKSIHVSPMNTYASKSLI